MLFILVPYDDVVVLFPHLELKQRGISLFDVMPKQERLLLKGEMGERTLRVSYMSKVELSCRTELIPRSQSVYHVL